MTSVCLCGSYRFLSEMNSVAAKLSASGVTCLWPKDDVLPDPKVMASDDARSALLDYLNDLDGADALYVFNKDGYLGRSMLVDIGYAYAKGKPVFAMEAIEDEFLSHMITATVSPRDLLAWLF